MTEIIKFKIRGENGNEMFGYSNCSTKTPYTCGVNSRPATKQEIKEGKPTYYPRRYFAYIIKDGKPIILVENRDTTKLPNGDIKLSPVYYKPATIKWNKSDVPFKHCLEGTDIPFLKLSVKSLNKSSNIKPNTLFHVNVSGKIICEEFIISDNIINWKR